MAATSKYLKPMREIFRHMAQEGKAFQKCASKCVVSEAVEGRCKLELKVEEEHTNQFGILHGGLTAALVDIGNTCALLCTPQSMLGVSIDLTISYISSAKPGDTVVFDSQLVQDGTKLAFTRCDVYHKDTNKVIAKAMQTNALR